MRQSSGGERAETQGSICRSAAGAGEATGAANHHGVLSVKKIQVRKIHTHRSLAFDLFASQALRTASVSPLHPSPLCVPCCHCTHSSPVVFRATAMCAAASLAPPPPPLALPRRPHLPTHPSFAAVRTLSLPLLLFHCFVVFHHTSHVTRHTQCGVPRTTRSRERAPPERTRHCWN